VRELASLKSARRTSRCESRTHIAIQEADDTGSPVTWGEHVTDEHYNAAPMTWR
jgi:hypothetical protein